jgi:glycosyltransferase involved in cell wall biosynthesis/SAM-dependent methyltransferase
MRVAFYSPMPPSPSGIADYSAALVEPLSRLCDLTAIEDATASEADVSLYQIGNNPFHAGAYQRALEHPGVVVLHEANLHHLIAEVTIRKGNWDGYLKEVEYDGGATALAYGQRVRSLEVGPDYDGVPMLRRVLANARGVIAHSDFVLRAAREAGFEGPVAKIPHGAWVDPVVPPPGRLSYRRKLGLDESVPLIGIFGHLKPYKRIAESLRAFRRLVRLDPRARLILAGEPHPDLNLTQLLRSLDLSGSVRLLGRQEIDDFTGYLGACDVVLNLRYPTVGETSGTLLRAFSLSRAVIVSDVGAFSEFPDEVCLKVPAGDAEEQMIFECMHLLVSRPDLAEGLGRRARAWVESECSWERTAELYHSFLKSVHEGGEWTPPDHTVAPPMSPKVEDGYIQSWSETEEARSYIETHITRLERTLEMVPPGTSAERILEMGAYLQITPALRTKLGYGEVRGCYYGPAGKVDERHVSSVNGEQFDCAIDLFDAEKDVFPYSDGHFSCVLCCELIEHLPNDPMHMMSEINRVLSADGHLVLTTPNIGSLRAIAGILQGYHPGFFPAYLRPAANGEVTDARHNREYTAREIYRLLIAAGFRVDRLETGAFLGKPEPELAWVADILDRYKLPSELRGDGIYIVGTKTGPVTDRYPAWLYS